MIYTVTFNPAIDWIAEAENLNLGSINRVCSERVFPGGKGVNISLVLKELGVGSCALGFAAGFTGAAIVATLEGRGIFADFVMLEEGFSRINLKISAGEETAINGKGPNISAAAVEKLMQKLDGLQAGDMVILAGSVPPSLPCDIYERIMIRLKGTGVKFAVDAEGDLLTACLKHKPFIVKPNLEELEGNFGKPLKSMEEIIAHGRLLQDMGSENVLISLGGDGAVLIDAAGGVYVSSAPEGDVISTVSAGDSMLAGVLSAWHKGGEEALKMGIACGSAAAFSWGTPDAEEINRVYKKL